MNTSEQINEIAAALAKAQGAFPEIVKSKTAKVKGESKSGAKFEYSYKYADIANVIDAISPVTSANGICYTQPTIMIDGAMYIETVLIHTSGQWMKSQYPVCSPSGDHQKMGAALTYARRYALCTALGVAAEEDTDGQGAETPPQPRQTKPVQRHEPKKQVMPPDDSFPGDGDMADPIDTDKIAYMLDAKAVIAKWTNTPAGLKLWWKGEVPHREAVGILNPSPEFEELFTAFKDKGLSLKPMSRSE